jgi:AraC-like DNA-binding protein
MIPPFLARRVIRGRYMFYPSGNRRPSPRIRVLCAGFEECSPEYALRRVGFPYAALELIVGGAWDLSSDGGKWRLEPGIIFTYGPATRYSLIARAPRGLRKYFVDFEGQDSARALRRAGLEPGFPARLSHPRWAQDLIEQLIDTARMEVLSKEKLGPMLAELLIERLRTDRESVEPRISGSRMTFDRCREYLTAHYLEINDFAQAAKTCGVSQVHLCRLFRRHAGETPQVFVTRMKMNHAAELIARGDVAVKTAALEVGFPDPYHFSRVFKKVHGSAPSKFCGQRC